MCAMITSIQKFCVHDGPGIRTTVFFKGCPMACTWCHNPETQNFSKEVLINREKCTACGRCATRCPAEAAQAEKGVWQPAPGVCQHCETCLDACTMEAREIVGEDWDCARMIHEIEKDRPFYESSGGGVTLSGGEVLSQPDAAAEIAEMCHRKGIHVVVDTCGYSPFKAFEQLIPFTDLFLYDLKLMDSEQHLRETGVDNRLILENLKKLSDSGAKIHLRLPLIVGLNAHDSHISAVIECIRSLKIQQVNLLPYHDTGSFKYQRLGREHSGERLGVPDMAWLQKMQVRFEKEGFQTKIGG